ncbi:MAG: 4-hydroxybutyrate CoA-transferase [Bacteroidia bacterium]|nr:4-hydroxybutyrate CoA-transferase [Bacteroidia bacterium]
MRHIASRHLKLTAEEAVSSVSSGDRVFVHGVAMTPLSLTHALAARASELEDVEIIHIHTEGQAPYADPALSASFKTNSCFVGSNVRNALDQGYGDYIPIFLSEIPLSFRRGILPVDVALISVSPPDKHGYCSLGSSVDVSLAALEKANFIIAEVNPQVPRTMGDGFIHYNEIDLLVEVNRPLHEIPSKPLSEIDLKIGKHIAELVEDGATLQMGIGSIPDAVLKCLGSHKKLGIHTEMFSDGVIELVEKGVITGEKKAVLPNVITSSFVMGSKAVYDFINDNPLVQLKDASFTNDTAIIRQNPKVTAINSAIEIDLTGQVCADTIGPRQFSGVGGQMDFIRGASLSEGGKPIIAISSTTKRGKSKIVPFLKEGAGVTTTRAHVHYVVTEYGVANLFGKNLRQRAKALIEIAHPDQRASLEEAAYHRFKNF